MRLPLLLSFAALVISACDSTGTTSQSVRYDVDGPATVAFSTDEGTSQITTSGPWSTSLNASSSTVVALTATSTTSNPVTASIYVDDALVRKRRGSSVHVEMSSSSSNGSSGSSSSEIEVRGPIEAIDASSVRVLGVTFHLSSNTRLVDDDDRVVQLSAFSVGLFVEIEGRLNGDGTFRATEMELDDDDGSSSGIEIEVEGTIVSIDAESFVVNGRKFVTNATTRYLDDRNNPIARSSFQVGQFVEAEGYVRSDGSVDAKKIKRDDD